MQSLLESYLNGKDTLETVADVHPENMKKAVAAMSDYQELVENVSAGAERPTGTWDSFMRWLRWRACTAVLSVLVLRCGCRQT